MENAIHMLVPGFFILITVVILGMIVYLTLKGMQEKKANDAAPIVTVDAKVKAKRIAVHHSAHQQSMNGVPLMVETRELKLTPEAVSKIEEILKHHNQAEVKVEDSSVVVIEIRRKKKY